MYHDQVLTPIKTIYEFDAINITLGLPFERVSPDHGPNLSMFGKNKSNRPLSPRKLSLFFILVMALFATPAAICQTNPVIITPDSLLVNQSSVIPEINIIEQLVKANNDIKKIEDGNKPESIIIKIDSSRYIKTVLGPTVKRHTIILI